MRIIYSFLLAVGAMSLAVGCTIESTSKPSPSNSGPYSPAPNGVAIEEQKACELLVGYVEKTATKHSCTITSVTCPDYLRQSGAPKCSLYDEGTVKGCEAHYASFESCDEIRTRPCRIRYIEDSAPNGCPEEPDKGEEGDAGPSDPDGGEGPDAEPSPDSGETLDAGPSEPDSGEGPDAEPDPDSGESPDAEPDPDSGESPDAEPDVVIFP